MNMTDLVRKFPCAVCKTTVTAKKILNGYLISCESGKCPSVSTDSDLSQSSWYMPDPPQEYPPDTIMCKCGYHPKDDSRRCDL